MAGETAEVAPAVGERTVRRIVLLIPTFGIVGALAAAYWRGKDWSEGLLLGAGLAWFSGCIASARM